MKQWVFWAVAERLAKYWAVLYFSNTVRELGPGACPGSGLDWSTPCCRPMFIPGQVFPRTTTYPITREKAPERYTHCDLVQVSADQILTVADKIAGQSLNAHPDTGSQSSINREHGEIHPRQSPAPFPDLLPFLRFYGQFSFFRAWGPSCVLPLHKGPARFPPRLRRIDNFLRVARPRNGYP